MNKICLFLILWCSLPTVASEPLRVMSFNVRFGQANDGENHWDHRKSFLVDTIKAFSPDLLGTQETLKFQADYISENVEGYEYFGRSRMKTPNEHCGIFYRKSRFTQLAGGHFWLSETPEVPESKSWDSSLPRMVSWVLLNDKTNETGDPILFVNTHFDHKGVQARAESGKLIRQRIESLKHLADNPIVILTGDFNTDEGSEPYQALLENNDWFTDTYREVHPERKPDECTFNSWIGRTVGARIDWIFVDSRLKVTEAEIVRTSRNERYPSDHYPVTAIVTEQ